MSRELELLDQLAGGPMSLEFIARHMFELDYGRALRSLQRLKADGLVSIRAATGPVEDWQMAAWLRSPDAEQSIQALAAVEAELTEAGAAWV